MTTDQEITDELAAHVRRLIEQRDTLTEEIDRTEQLLQDLGTHLAVNRNSLNRAATPERMTVADTTRYLRASKNTIKGWIATDSIPHHIDTDGRRYLLKSEVDRWLATDSRPRLQRVS